MFDSGTASATVAVGGHCGKPGGKKGGSPEKASRWALGSGDVGDVNELNSCYCMLHNKEWP